VPLDRVGGVYAIGWRGKPMKNERRSAGERASAMGKGRREKRVSSLGRPSSDFRSTSGAFNSRRDCTLSHRRSNRTKSDLEDFEDFGNES
jgi:hypothetical protein